MPTFEVHLPLRNPGEELERTVEALRDQTTKDFAVVVSDNHSSSGEDLIEQAIERLAEAKISVRKVRPGGEMDRVAHWNWLHAQAEAEWVKPFLAGDAPEPRGLARFQEAVALAPEAGLVVAGGGAAGAIEARVMKRAILRRAWRFGPPGTYAFSRAAFLALGGYQPKLPRTAGGLLCAMLAARCGIVAMPEALVHSAPPLPRPTWGERLTAYRMLVRQARTEQQPSLWADVARAPFGW